MKRLSVWLYLTLISSVSLFAQETGRLSGKVSSGSARPLRNATLHLINTQFSTISDSEGQFAINGVPLGKYTLEISAVGHAVVNRIVNVSAGTEELEIAVPESAVQLDAVTVTAQKKEESLQSIPSGVSVLSSRDVQQFRLWNSRDLTGIIPGLYASNPGDNRNVTSVRGIISTSYDPAVATYVDGVNQFSLDTYIAQLSDVERIEVLRGPQGTLYGRNAMGGVINIITKQPSNNTTGFAEVNAGNYGQQRYSAGIRTPLIKNKLFFGASGVLEKRDGFYTNEFNNSSFDKVHAVTGNYYLKYLASPRWTVGVNVKHHHNRNSGAFPLVNGMDEAFNNPFKLNQNAVAKMVDDVFNGSLTVNHNGRSFNFSSQTAYQSNNRYYKAPLDGDFSPIDGVTVIKHYGKKYDMVEAFTQEFKFSSLAVSKIQWTVGSYLFYQDNPVKQATHFGADGPLVGAPGSFFSVINTAKGTGTGVALYGQFRYPVTDKLDLVGGLRYDHESKKQSVLSEYQEDSDPAPQFALVPDTSAKANFNAVSPTAGLLFHVDETKSVYVNYSRGYRAGGLTQLSSDPSQPPLYAYEPEYSNSFEAGFKSSFYNNRLRFNAAVFYIRVNNAQVPSLILPEAFTVTRNVGKLTSRGFEAEISATPVKGLKIDYNAAFIKAVYNSLKLPQNGQEVDLDGNRQIFTPDVTSMLAVQYSHMIWKEKGVSAVARGEWFYIGRKYFDLSNNLSQSPYNLLNTRVGFSTRFADIMFWKRNITNRKYVDFAYDFGAVHLAEPSTWGVTLSLSF